MPTQTFDNQSITSVSYTIDITIYLLKIRVLIGRQFTINNLDKRSTYSFTVP